MFSYLRNLITGWIELENCWIIINCSLVNIYHKWFKIISRLSRPTPTPPMARRGTKKRPSCKRTGSSKAQSSLSISYCGLPPPPLHRLWRRTKWSVPLCRPHPANTSRPLHRSPQFTSLNGGLRPPCHTNLFTHILFECIHPRSEFFKVHVKNKYFTSL